MSTFLILAVAASAFHRNYDSVPFPGRYARLGDVAENAELADAAVTVDESLALGRDQFDLWGGCKRDDTSKRRMRK